MNRVFVLVAFLIFGLKPAVFCRTADFEFEKLEIHWKLLENNYDNKKQFLAEFTIVNNSALPLAAADWKLYFSYPREITSVVFGEVKFQYLRGDFNVMFPESGFIIAPGEAKKVRYIAKGTTQNYTDAPSGFYVVPKAGADPVSIKNLTIEQLKANGIVQVCPEQLYRKYDYSIDSVGGNSSGIIPTPAHYSENSSVFQFSSDLEIVSDKSFSNEASFLAEDLFRIFKKRPPIVNKGSGKAIVLKKVRGLKEEGYKLSVQNTSITIEASFPSGIFYGVQSLKAMFPPAAYAGKIKSFPLSGLEIKDSPRFPYRAFMLDVARNFQTKQQVLKILDLMAMYKMNVLHFHLNDDEGWRLEIPALPELTAVSSNRGHTTDNTTHLQPAYGSGPKINIPPGSGFYSKDDFVEILKYAAKRHIKIIPEVETPGHARAAIKAMDARYRRLMSEGKIKQASEYLLRDFSDRSVYKSVQGYNDNVINAALPSTYRFIETVVDEIIKMYGEAGAPLHTIHFGGDEVPAGAWTKSPAIDAFLKDHPQADPVNGLWFYYFGKVHEILEAKGLYLSGWEEIAMKKVADKGKFKQVVNPGFLNKNFHVYVWNNAWGKGSEDLPYKLANAGYKVILAPVTNFYFDLAYTKDVNEPGLYWGGFIDTDKPFYFNPLDQYKTAKEMFDGTAVNPKDLLGKEWLTEEGKSNIVGIQCLLWTEKVTSAPQLEYMLFPKMIGFAERAWAKEPDWAKEKDTAKSELLYRKDWARFSNTLGRKLLPHLDYFEDGINYRIPPAGAVVKDYKVYALAQFPGLVIRYTTDGSEPNASSKIYTIPVRDRGLIKLRVFNARGNRFSRTVEISNP